jgi:hypothetical protein
MVQWAVEQWAPLALQGTLSDAPFTAWWLRAWFLRWAGQAEELQLLNFIWHAWQVPRLRALLRSWRQLGPVNAQFGARATLDMDRIGRAAIGVGIAVPWEPGGTEGRRWRDEDGAWRAVSFSKGMAHAWRAWKAAGGHKAMDRERGFRRDVEETRRAARLSDWLERCGRRISPALAALANARRLLRQRPVARRRMLLNEEVGSGLAADGRGRWAVESILAWRGGAGDRAALVRWSGFDPATGEPWADSWEPRAALTSDLRGGGLIRRRRTAAAIREEERRAREDWDERHTRTRKSRRLQGEASEEENSLHVPIEVERDQSESELYVRLPSSVLCAGTFGGRCLGVGRRAVSAVITVTVTELTAMNFGCSM